MPYIEPEARKKYQNLIKSAKKILQKVPANKELGEINYLFSEILSQTVLADVTYADAAGTIGLLETMKAEIYRRVIAPYEDLKNGENGEVFTYIYHTDSVGRSSFQYDPPFESKSRKKKKK